MGKCERWIIYPILGALCLSLFGGWLPLSSVSADSRTSGLRSANYQTVRCRRLEVVGRRDTQGVVVTFGSDDRPAIWLLDPTSKKSVAKVGVDREGGFLSIGDRNGQWKVFAACARDHPYDGFVKVYGGILGKEMRALRPR